MPRVRLSDWAKMRLDTISFFLLLLLLIAFVAQKLWNNVARDFSRLPQLSYKRALSLTFLLGLGLSLVLSMISGARELFTPGAWQRNGLIYNVSATPSASDQLLHLRKQKLEGLRDALWAYAAKHEQKLPATRYSAALPARMWESVHPSYAHYVYHVGTRRLDGPIRVIAYEPASYEKEILVLYSDGRVLMKSREALKEELDQ